MQKQSVRNTTSLFADDPHEGTYCCLGCKKEIKRTYVPFIKKYGISTACPCVVAEREREQLESDRRYRKGKMERVFSRSIMNDNLKQATFQNFIKREGTESVLSAFKEFVRTYESRKTGILAYGPPGNGKSHLAASAHHTLDHQGYVCLFLDFPQLVEIAKGTFKNHSKVSITDIVSAAVSCDLLTLDELGAGSLTEFEYKDLLFPILNGRQGKLTNFTTNLNLEQLEMWLYKDKSGNVLDEQGRLFDRILGSVDIYENKGTSKRREDALKRLNEGQ
ncbi:hypothetical protein BK126_03130 [Paenibacillus sp. FSL H7-0326]|nr:hypothetical protein BK126_03130 [Paenibacillus sp. FSL H7-0326]